MNKIKEELKEILKGVIERGELPSDYFRNMPDNELKEKYPELAVLKGNMQRPDFHPEGDVFEHTMQIMDSASLQLAGDFKHLSYEEKEIVLVGTFTHDFGKDPASFDEKGNKNIDAKTGYPSHAKHESMGVPIAEGFIDRIDAPEWKKGVSFITENHGKMHALKGMKPETIIAFAKDVEKNVGFDAFVVATSSDSNGRKEKEGEFFVKKDRTLTNNFREVATSDIHPNTTLLKLGLEAENKFQLDETITLPEAVVESIKNNDKIPQDKKESAINSRTKKLREDKLKKDINAAFDAEKAKTADNESLSL